MARTIAPGQPTPIKPVEVDIPNIDLKLFEKIGDEKVKTATQNFQLYATTTSAAEAQKLYEKYKNNPVALANALSKLPGMFKDLPQSIQDQMKAKMDTTAISLVTKAQSNQEKLINKQNTAMAHANATLNMGLLSDDYFNILGDMTAGEGEKKPILWDIYAQHRAELQSLASMTDENGSPLFSESVREKMLMPKEAAVAGFKRYIYRPNLDQLIEWDQNVFQKRDEFMKRTGINDATYDEMEKAMLARIRQLKSNDRKIKKTQAELETAELLKTGDEMKAKILEENPDAPKKLVKRALELNKKFVENHWYDPDRESDPGALLEVISVIGKAAQSPDTSPDGMEKKIELLIDAGERIAKNRDKLNMSDEDVNNYVDWMYSSIADKGFIDNINALDVKPWVDGVIAARKADMEANPAMYEPEAISKLEETTEAYHAKGKLSPLEKKAKESAEASTWKSRGIDDRNTAHKLAYDKAHYGLLEIINYLKATGNRDAAKNMWDQLKYDYVKTYNSNWIPNSDFDKLQAEYEKGKKPIYFHNGINWEYQGYQTDGSNFKVKL